MITDKIKNITEPLGSKGNQEEISYEVISTEEEFDAIKSEWVELARHAESEIFQTYHWQRIWWRFYGEGSQLNIVLIRKSEELIGILPTFIDSYQSFGRPVYRCLRFIGSSIMQPGNTKVTGFIAQTGYLDIIAKSGYEEAIVKSVEDYLNNYCSEIHRVIFDEVPEGSLLRLVTKNFKKKQPEYWTVSLNNASVCPLIRFPETWDQFLGNLSSNSRYQIRRDVKKVYNNERKQFDLKMIESTKELTVAYRMLVDYHQKRWNQRFLPGNFANKSKYNFMKEILKRFYELGYLQFQVLTPKDKPDEYLALDLLFNYKKKIYLIERAFNVDSDRSDVGFGNVLLYSIIKEGIEKGEKEYDFLRGAESYKLRTANHVAQNVQITFDRLNSFKYVFELIQLRIDIKRRFNWEIAALKAQALEKDYFRAAVQLTMARLHNKLKKTS